MRLDFYFIFEAMMCNHSSLSSEIWITAKETEGDKEKSALKILSIEFYHE